jgi:hypothetical protein
LLSVALTVLLLLLLLLFLLLLLKLLGRLGRSYRNQLPQSSAESVCDLALRPVLFLLGT